MTNDKYDPIPLNMQSSPCALAVTVVELFDHHLKMSRDVWNGSKI